jgi:hypothetical protein
MSLACSKTIYVDRPAALAAIKGWANEKRAHKKNSGASPSHAYFCEGCNGWHIMTEGKRVVRKKTAPKETRTIPDQFIKKHKEYGNLVIRNFTSKPL